MNRQRVTGQVAARDRRRTVGLFAAVMVGGLGLVAVVWGILGLAQDRSTPHDFGVTAPATTGTWPPPLAMHSRRSLAAEAPAAGPANPTMPPPDSPSITTAAPTKLTIPAIQLHASIRPVENVHGSLVVPDNPDDVGWWAGGALPGSAAGSVVLDGHVDSTDGPGALFRLTELERGDTIWLTTAAHQALGYKVTGRRAFAKAGGLPSDLFSTSDAPRLVLITCGGRFNTTTRSYDDNIIVFAMPA